MQPPLPHGFQSTCIAQEAFRDLPMTLPSYPVRPDVLEFDPYVPGLSIEEIRGRYGLDNIIKLASNENPLGVSPLVQKRLAATLAGAFRYAPAGTPRLVNALSAFLGVNTAHIVVGNGSDEIIDLLVRVCPTPGKHNVVACKPSFSIYRLQSKLCGVEFRTVPLNNDFSFDWAGLRAAIDENTALVFITTPDNPSGFCPPRREVAEFARSLPPTCLLVVDEAYVDFCEDDGSDDACASLLPLWPSLPNTVILRTFSKIAGLAGLRLGYGIMPQKLAAAVQAVKLPFSVNCLAEEAGIAVLEDTVFLETTRQTVREGRIQIAEYLKNLGCMVVPSHANFLLFALPPACHCTARQVFEKLLAKGIIIRPLASYNLGNHLRVSIGTGADNKAFLEAFTECICNA